MNVAIAKVSNGVTMTYSRMDDFYNPTDVTNHFQALVDEVYAGETFEWCIEDVDVWNTEIITNGKNIDADVSIVDGSVQYS